MHKLFLNPDLYGDSKFAIFISLRKTPFVSDLLHQQDNESSQVKLWMNCNVQNIPIGIMSYINKLIVKRGADNISARNNRFFIELNSLGVS